MSGVTRQKRLCIASSERKIEELKFKDIPVLNSEPRCEDVLGSGVIAPHILIFRTRWR
jgi:hypothetical protein